MSITGPIHSDPEVFASWLEECLTWRQLRKLAKRYKVHQYSYLGKRPLSLAISIYAYNRYSRKHGSHS